MLWVTARLQLKPLLLLNSGNPAEPSLVPWSMFLSAYQSPVESRGAAFGLMILQGIGTGLAGAAVGAGYGLWRHGPALSGLLKGVDLVGMILCLLSAYLMYGAYLTNKVEVGAYARLGEHQHVRMTKMPVRLPVTVLLGGLICQGIVLALYGLK